LKINNHYEEDSFIASADELEESSPLNQQKSPMRNTSLGKID